MYTKNADHYLKDCLAYVTAQNKFEKLRFISGCTKCSLETLILKAVTYKFKTNCKFCQDTLMNITPAYRRYDGSASDGSVVCFQKTAVAVLALVVVFLKTAVAVLMRLC